MKIIVNGIEWVIILTKDSENLKRSDGTITLGVTDLNCKCVFLWAELEPYMLRKVLIHELSHVFIFSYGYSMTLDEEEFLCSFIDTYASDIINLTESTLKTSFGKISKFS